MRLRYHIMLLVAVVLGIYYPAIFAPLNSVDDSGMYLHLLNTDQFSLRTIFLPGGSGGYYRPLLQTSFLIDKYVWGLEESFMHLNNILLHLGNTLLVFFIARKTVSLLDLRSTILPLAAAVLFAVHPINTEAVNWISGRTDLLAAFFLLLSVWLLLNRPFSLVFSLLSALSVLLACLSKETALFFLPAAIILPLYLQAGKADAPPLRMSCLKAIPHAIIVILAGAGYFLLRMQALAKGDEGVARVVTHVAGSQSADPLATIRVVIKTAGFYAKKLFIPFPLNFGIIHVSDFYIFIGLLVCILIAWLLTRRTITSFFFIAAAAVGASALMIPLLNTTWTPVAERYMYIPSAFFTLGIMLSLGQCRQGIQHQNRLVVLAGLLAIVACYGTFTRNLLWQDNLALYRDTLRKSPGFVPAQNEIAVALNRMGRTEEAQAIYKSFTPREDLKNFQYGIINKAGALANSGDYAEARRVLQDALLNPGKHEVLILQKMLEVSKVEIIRGKTTSGAVYGDSVKRLSRLYEITGDPFYQYRLGVVNLHEKNYSEALAAFSVVCKTAPKDIYYRKPAEKLVAKLSAKSGNSNKAEGVLKQ
jgi:hypothetical protein